MNIIDNSNMKTEYEIKYPWPKNTFCQCGSSGIVLSKKGNYKTAYFEAFPKNPDMFVRGEGENIAEAEKNAYEKFIRWTSCKNHKFEKISKNGMGKCTLCGFTDTVFETEYTCIVCGKKEQYINILKKYKKEKTDCMCEECTKKTENLKYLSDLNISELLTMKNGLLLLHCACDEETFNLLRTKPDTLENFYAILAKDSNIYLLENAKRMLSEKDEDSEKYENLCPKVNTYDELYDFYYENYIKRWVTHGYK